jgi:hypothetical protein
VSLASFVLYLLTTARYQIAGDTPDFLVAAKTLGVPHAPGYPTLTILGHVFSWLPIGSVAFRIDLLAAVCGAATVALVYASALRLTRRPWAAMGAALALASTPLFWKWSLQIETFPLNNVLAALIVYLLIRWHQEPDRSGFLIAASAAFGVGLTNQQTIALLAPAIAVLLWLNREKLLRRPTVAGWAALGLAAGLLPYVYVPLASAGHPPENWDNVNSLSSFVGLVTRRDYGGTGLQGSVAAAGNYFARWEYLLRSFGLVLGLLAMVGVVVAFFRLRWYWLLAATAFLMSTVITLAVVTGDPHAGAVLFVLERFFLLPLVIATPLAAVGLAAATDWLAQAWKTRAADRERQLFAVGATGVILLLSVLGVVANYSTLDVSGDRVTDNYARQVLSGLRPHAILFVTGDFADLPILYAHAVEHVRPDVAVVISPLLNTSWYQAELRRSGALNVPASVSTLGIVQANGDRPIDFVGNPPDKSLDGSYFLYLDGLTYDLEPQSTNISVDQAIADNTAKLASYAVPVASAIKPVSFEGAILAEYANIPSTIGQDYEADKDSADALTWFRKALAIDPRNGYVLRQIHQLTSAP